MKTLLATLLLTTGAALAQEGMPPTSTLETREVAADQLDTIGVTVDPQLSFIDERGYPFQLRQWFPGEVPVVLILGYYSCPRMCGQVLGEAFRALSDVDFEPGKQYRILNVSIDPKETPEIAKARKTTYLRQLAKIGGDDAWRVLVGDQDNITKLTKSVGFNYYWSDATQQFSHPPSLIFLTKDGKVSRIVKNTTFEPEDLRLALVEASEGKLGTFLDEVRLNCLTFDSRTNTYSLTARTVMRVGGVVTVLALGAMIWILLRKERQQAATAQPQPSSS
ncbi:MAG: SCO family protein [Planctomycetota bacterium]|jgi:protein SCO1/2